MIEGLLWHGTDAQIEANHTDTHGASVVGFAFTELLGFKLLPRLKNIGSIGLYVPGAGPATWPKLDRVLKSRPVNWDLIASHYDQMIKYAAALRRGSAEAEQVLRRFTRGAVEGGRIAGPMFPRRRRGRDRGVLGFHEAPRR